MKLHVTSASAITAVGLTATGTAAAVRAGVSRLCEYLDFTDAEDNPIIGALLPDPEDWAEPEDRLLGAAETCLARTLEHARISDAAKRSAHIWLAAATPDRASALYETSSDPIPRRLYALASTMFDSLVLHVDGRGQAATLHALREAEALLDRDPSAVCVLGAADSFLQSEQLEFFEEGGRLKSASLGRAHGLSPSEATGFIVVESERAARGRSLATILSVATTDDPTPRSGPAASTGQALSRVIREALASASLSARDVDAVVCDLDGEFARSKEWGYADLRVLDARKPDRLLLHPADCFGAIGTAFPVVLLSIIATSRGWLDGNNLVFASDDDGPCGAAIVRRTWRPAPAGLA